MAPVVNLCLKFDANIFIGDRYMAILLLRRFGCEMPIPAHFGRFLGVCPPLSVVRYCQDREKAHSWPETRIFGV